MKVYLLSDLHLEGVNHAGRVAASLASKFVGVEPGDVLVLAGDIGYPLNADLKPSGAYLQVLVEFKRRFSDVVLVAGNHCYYRALEASMERTLAALHTLADTAGVHFLHQRAVTIRGVCFAGCTLWSEVTAAAFCALTDSKLVFKSHEDYLERHRSDVAWLRAFLEAPTTLRPVIMVTHHLPSYAAIHPVYAASELNSGFASGLDDVIGGNRHKLALWCAGHTHKKVDAVVEGVRVVVNPVGYLHELAEQPQPTWIPVHIEGETAAAERGGCG
jgi:predicted phosphodiesterase